jgi:hypothetical protein
MSIGDSNEGKLINFGSIVKIGIESGYIVFCILMSTANIFRITHKIETPEELWSLASSSIIKPIDP